MIKYELLRKNLKKNQHTWLITGVAGFIGSNLLEELLILNQKVVGIDNFETGYQHNISQAIQDANKFTKNKLKKNFKFIKGDIKNLKDCKKACKGVDYVLHQAALGSVPRSIEKPIITNEININGFLNILVASKEAKVKRLVYASSSSVYGDKLELPKLEDQIGNPLSPYALTKLVNELYADVFSRNFSLNAIGLRYFNVFGKRQDPSGPYAAVIPKWISAILNEDDVKIFGDGETSRDFCYIDNVIQMNLLAATLKLKDANHQVYNVALNERINLKKLHQMILTQLKKKVKNFKIKKPVYLDFRKGDVKHSMANIEKAKTIGYHPEYNVQKGLKKSIDWYISNLRKL